MIRDRLLATEAANAHKFFSILRRARRNAQQVAFDGRLRSQNTQYSSQIFYTDRKGKA
jgi:hypothetical protein